MTDPGLLAIWHLCDTVRLPATAYSAGQIAPLYEGNALIQNSALLALIKAD